ncbi:MAG: hydrogenase maturation nickel metallochaperone HypA [Ignavibacteriae bacterium]|nr:hydrogenase maturation nickel metallochaperone HypA [Ignavibacteriota bacterium]
MHEMSVAQNILSIIQHQLSEEQMRNALLIHLRIGDAAGIVPESLEFCFNAITAESPLHSATLSIERIPLQLHCNTCNTDSISESGMFLCQQCGASDINVIAGTELQLVDIELNDAIEESA